MEVKIGESWKPLLQAEFDKPYFAEIKNKLLEERRGYTIYPPANLWFHAFDMVVFDQVKVVLLGQDPYHGP